jgi:hypothetical protein
VAKSSFVAFVEKISWIAFFTWVGIWIFLTLGIFFNEELGILHKFGLQPITWAAVGDFRLFLVIFAGGPVFSGWWWIHWYRRKYGDLKPK